MAGILENLMTAIYSKATGNAAFNTAMGGRIYQEQARTANGTPVTTYPYAVFKHISDYPKYTFTSDYADVLIQWSLYDNSPSPANMQTYITKLQSAFDDTSLSITGWTLIRVSREGHVVLPPDENGMRHSATTYRILAQKN